MPRHIIISLSSLLLFLRLSRPTYHQQQWSYWSLNSQTYQSAARHYIIFCSCFNFSPFSLHQQTVARFVADLTDLRMAYHSNPGVLEHHLFLPNQFWFAKSRFPFFLIAQLCFAGNTPSESFITSPSPPSFNSQHNETVIQDLVSFSSGKLF